MFKSVQALIVTRRKEGMIILRGRRLKLWQKKLLKAEGYDWKDYLYVRQNAEGLEFRQRSTEKILSIRR